jgi:hypothetical protein
LSRIYRRDSIRGSTAGSSSGLAGARADETLAITELARAKELYKKNVGPEADAVKWQGKLGTVLAVMMKGADNNANTQVDITLLIGLASKNVILIVEFAMAEQEHGKSLVDAAVDTAKLRFRPVLMTSIASIAGFMPLVVASGAASQQAIGLSVVGDMAAATIMSLSFTPVFSVVMKRLGEKGGAEAVVRD